jgi:hypothetical protein
VPSSAAYDSMEVKTPFSLPAVDSISGEELGAMLGEMLAGIRVPFYCPVWNGFFRRTVSVPVYLYTF